MSILSYIAIAVCLSFVAFIAAIFGIGGGTLYTPIQLFFGVEFHEAAAISLFQMIALSIGATLIYRRARKVDWVLAIIFAIFTMGGGFLGGYLSNYISGDILSYFLIIAIVLSGILMLVQPEKRRSDGIKRLRFGSIQRVSDDDVHPINLFVAIPMCLIAGMVSGMIGIGGGVLMVPMMSIIFGMPIDISIATSGFVVGLTAIGGFGGHYFAGVVNWQRCLIFTPGILIGSMLGARFMLGVNKKKLKRAFGVLMFLMALGLILKITN